VGQVANLRPIGNRPADFRECMPKVAKMVVDAIRELQTYRLHASVVMPNHVHLLITPLAPVSELMQSLKRFTAREGNRILGLTGQPFWQDESFDRLMRNDTESKRIIHYIERNPVTVGLAVTPEDFPLSGARPIANRPQVCNLPHI
jgi:REP element-mobilizing transposase RayT